ncbi:MAG TPA: tRNA lysidine(34) synthetase TilS [Qipengyuania sp.]|nr:tRNA lysidine(34) synthetase TilS [Qipengyuania sp.]
MRASAIDSTLEPQLTARFAADLARLWPEGEGGTARLGLAVSGGADSLALLLLAAATLPGRVEAATVDHGLRAESADEAAMVARVCAELIVPHEVLAVTIAPGNLQDRARAARYAALAKWCERRGLAALATAHQLDDQAETLAMRLNRGSGLAGLAGVRARGTVPGGQLPLLRPLLDWRRAELPDVVAVTGLEPAQDPSNEDERFDRVRMRRALAGADWLDPKGLASSATHLAEAERFIGEQIAAMAHTRLRAINGGYALDPPPSDFAAIELCASILAKLDVAARRSEVAALVARLRRGENASLGGVLTRVVGDEWVFAPEPPRSR